jgi:perosamine synthetase
MGGIDMHIPAHRIVFTEKEIIRAQLAVREIMSSGQMILGNYTEEFEYAYANLHGRLYGVAVASDTAAIEIALRIYGIGEGDKVLFPANGFYGVVIPILRCGADPVFFDINWEENLFVHEDSIEELIRMHNPKALILMHTGGLVASRSKQIGEVCRKHGVICIEDAAHAPGAKMNGEYAGSFGDVSCFSLYATKPINAGEGGMILTDDLQVADLSRIYRNYGRTSTFSSSVCAYQGYSWRLTEIQAAIGLGQVNRQDEIRVEREEIATRYDKLIKPLLDEGIIKYVFAEGSEPNWYRYLMVLPIGWDLKRKESMKKIIASQKNVAIPGDVYEMPVPHQPVWGGAYDHLNFPASKEWGGRHFALPIYNTLTEEEQIYIIDSVVDIYRQVM